MNIFWIVDDVELDREYIADQLNSVDPTAEFIPFDSYSQVDSACDDKSRPDPTAVILDYMLGDSEKGYVLGIQSLKRIRERSKVLPVFMLTGEGSPKHVLNPLNLLLKYRVLDGYFEKTGEQEMSRLKTRLGNVLALRESNSISLNWTEFITKNKTDSYKIVGTAGWMYRDLSRKAIMDAPVLIQGPTGSGKELIARRIHEESFRKDRPFVPVNCSAIPDTLFESEFFGYVKGAFTGAKVAKKGYFLQANGGTLFLDEVADLTPLGQAKLLRAVEYGFFRLGATRISKPNVRIISATHRDLQDRVRKGQFRHDLYYRLCGVRYPKHGLKDPEISETTYEKDLEEFIKLCLAEEYKKSRNKSSQYEKTRKNLLVSKEKSDDPEFRYAAEMTIQRLEDLKDLFTDGASLDPSSENEEWLDKASAYLGIPHRIPIGKWEEFTAHSWLGNYREVGWVVRTVISEGGWEYAKLEDLGEIEEESMQSHLERAAELHLPESLSDGRIKESKRLSEFEVGARAALMRRAHAICHGDRQSIAGLLGVSDSTVSKDNTYMELQGLTGDE